jgi:hypothetical protein
MRVARSCSAGGLAILTGNSGAHIIGAADSVPAAFIRQPLMDAGRGVIAVPLSRQDEIAAAAQVACGTRPRAFFGRTGVARV